ncbi:MAG TPA: FapA family protein [Ruminiclostridium sp.]
MESTTIYTSPFIEITKKSDGFYLQSYKKGFSVDEFNKIIGSHPEIQISNFTVIKEALVFAPQQARNFAFVKEKVVIEVSGDELRAFITLNVNESELEGTNIIKEVVSKLYLEGVIYGIKKDAFLSLYLNKPILIAEGLLPVAGADSENKVYKLKEIRPEIKEDGNVDHYELNLINMVEKGEWLGERIQATQGKEGRTVRGNPLKPMPGKNYPFLYDKKTVKEIGVGNKSTFYAISSGAVFFKGDSIGVSNHLEIEESIGVKTGNVDFDGYLTIKGTVEDNFSVASTKDIEVLSEYGVGNVKEIRSHEGSIYIRGGIVGRGKTTIRCKKNLYIKYVADADIFCEGSVHVGFYCLNSNITAKEVILDSIKGQIMGGTINAEIRVISAILGSSSEKRTNICVKGFDRNDFKNTLDDLSQKINIIKAEIYQYKQRISIFSNIHEGGQARKDEYDSLNEKYNDLRISLQENEENKKNMMNYLRTKGEGEITILKNAFPNTMLEIKKVQKEIQRYVFRVSYYYNEGIIKEM